VERRTQGGSAATLESHKDSQGRAKWRPILGEFKKEFPDFTMSDPVLKQKLQDLLRNRLRPRKGSDDGALDQALEEMDDEELAVLALEEMDDEELADLLDQALEEMDDKKLADLLHQALEEMDDKKLADLLHQALEEMDDKDELTEEDLLKLLGDEPEEMDTLAAEAVTNRKRKCDGLNCEETL
jgi:hypothetical protein